MSDKSKDLRLRAAKELRESRNGGSKDEKADNVKRAAAYKDLAANEEWLDGKSVSAQTNSVWPCLAERKSLTKAEQEKTGLKGADKQQADLQNLPDRDLPEGLQRPRKGSLDAGG